MVRARIVPVILASSAAHLSACGLVAPSTEGPTTDPGWHPAAQAPAPTPTAPTIQLASTAPVPGLPIRYTVSGATPGATAWILGSPTVDRGLCPPILDGSCLALDPPLAVLGSATVDPSGQAVITAVLPTGAPLGSRFRVQAATPDAPTDDVSNLVVHALDGDGDGDGVPDEVDPCPRDPLDDVDGDGVCAFDDLCLGDDASGDTDGDGRCDDSEPLDLAQACTDLAGLSLSPADPRTGDALVAQVSWSDARAAGLLRVAWSVDGAPTPRVGSVLPSAFTAKGQAWTATARLGNATDHCVATATTTLANTPPDCDAVSITPVEPFAGDDLDCACVDFRDADGDPPADPTCLWTDATGTTVGTSCSLSGAEVFADQVLTCTLTPSDGEDEGAPAHAVALPGNRQAMLLGAGLEADADPLRGDQPGTLLTCGRTALDLEGDPIHTTWTWQVAGSVVHVETDTAETHAVSMGQLEGWLGRPLVRGDLVRCSAEITDGISSGTPPTLAAPPLTVANTPPEVLSVTLADARADGVFSCAPVLADADGDVPVLTASYLWESAALGALPSTERDLDTAGLGLTRGDTLTCTVSVDDGFAAADGTSAPATVLNRLPVIGALVGDGENVVRSAVGGTIRCGAAAWSDGDGDPEATRCAIHVDGVEVAAATLGAGEVLEVTDADASWTVGTPVVIEATPWDGLEDGPTVTRTPEVRTGTPTRCLTARVRDSGLVDRTHPYTCECAQWSDADPDPVTEDDRCVWWLKVERDVRRWDRDEYREPATTPLYQGCDMPPDVPPLGTIVECLYTAVDSRSGASTPFDVSNEVQVEQLAWPPPTFPSPNVTLSPGPTLGVTYTGDLRCDWDDTGVTTSGLDGVYQVAWRVNGTRVTPFRDWPTDPDPEALPLDGSLWFEALNWHVVNMQILPSARDLAPGDTVECGVRAHDGANGSPWQWSAPTVLRDPIPGELRDLAILPDDAVQSGGEVTCRVEVEPGAPGTIGLVLEGDDGSGGWTALAEVQTDTESDLSLTFTPDDTTPAPLRCRAWRDDGAGAVDLDLSPTIDVATDPGQILDLAITPDGSEPCVARACALTLSTPIGSPRDGMDLVVDTTWLVDGAVAATSSTAVTNPVLAASFETAIPTPAGLTLAPGSTLACAVDVRLDGGATVVSAASAPSAVAGEAPSIGTVGLPLTVRDEGTATCLLTDLASACGEDPDVLVRWMLDGVEIGTGPQLDTEGLPVDSVLVCEATPVDPSGIAGPAVASPPSEIQPSQWVIQGAAAGDFAGMSVASVGDLTGDGRPEILIGAPNATTSSLTSAGRIWLVKAAPGDRVTDLATVDDGQGGWTWRGVSGGWDPDETWCHPDVDRCEAVPAGTSERPSFEAPLGDGLGTRVRAAGDMDGDGVPDFVVSAPYALAHGDYLAGRTYQISGASIGTGRLTIGQLEELGGRSFEGVQGIDPDDAYVREGGSWFPDPWHDGHLSGIGLATADLDGDGYRDLFIGALGAEGDLEDLSGEAPNAGGAWAIRGGPGLRDTWLGALAQSDDYFPDELDEGYVEGATWTGVDRDGYHRFVALSSEVGRHLVGLGDMDGDGDDEVLVSHTGGLGWDGGIWNASYLVMGGAFTDHRFADPGDDVVVLATGGAEYSTSWSIPWAVESGRTDWFGMASGAGDVNGDGLADMVIPYTEHEDGAPQSEVAVFFGRPDLTTLDVEGPDQGQGGFVIEGVPSPNGYNLMRAAALGDVDGDGLDDIALAFSVPREGDRLAIVYGRTDTSSLRWSDILDGTAGQWFAFDTFGGMSDVTGDDVDGDGLGDLIFGKANADVDGVGEDAGQVVVWFGRDLRGRLTAQGTLGDDALVGTPAQDRIIGRRGHDLLDGAGGPDVLYGGAGDDTLVVADTSFLRLQGGLGHDTLTLDLAGTVDLSALRGRVRGVETVDLTQGAVRLVAERADVLRIPDLARTLTILGDGDDVLELPEDGWQLTDVLEDGFVVVTNGAATLIVDPAIPIQAAPTLIVEDLVLDENSPVGTLAGRVDAEDVGGAPVLVTVASSGWFTFDPVSGALTLARAELDHEGDDDVPIEVCAQAPSGLETCRWFAVRVRDVPEPPAFTVAWSETSTPEYAPYDSTIALLAAEDPDEGDSLTYGWLSEDHVGSGSVRQAFEVDPTTGRVYVVDPASLDFESAPVVELVVSVVDSTGLGAERALTVSLIDRETQTQTLTLPLISEDEVLDPSGALAALVLDSEASTDTVSSPDDVSKTFDIGHEGGWPAIYMDYELSGDVLREYDAEVTVPNATIYLPAELSIAFPDDIVLGQPFEPTTDWTLQDDAVMSGTSLGLAFDFTLGLQDFDLAIYRHDELLSQIGPVTTRGTLGVEIDAEPIVGRKLDVLYPNGVSLTDATPPVHLCFYVDPDVCPSLPPTCEVVDDPGCDRPEGARPATPDGECGEARCFVDLEGKSGTEIDEACPGLRPTPDFDGCLAAVAEDNLEWLFHSVMDGFVNDGWIRGTDSVDFDDVLSDPDTLIVPTVTSRLIRLPTNPLQIVDDLGAPVLAPTRSDFTIPFDSGRADVRIVGYWSPIFATVDTQELYGTRLEGLLGTLTFEGGTTVQAELREGFGALTLPPDEDVNGDGRLDFTLTVEPDATLIRFFAWTVGVSLPTKAGAGDVTAYAEVFDPLTGTTSSFPIGDESFGPLFEDTWEWSRAVPDDDVIQQWTARGFEPIVLEGSLQLTRP